MVEINQPKKVGHNKVCAEYKDLDIFEFHITQFSKGRNMLHGKSFWVQYTRFKNMSHSKYFLVRYTKFKGLSWKFHEKAHKTNFYGDTHDTIFFKTKGFMRETH
jgi:hypothetical protein